MSKISIAGERLHKIILAPVVSEKSTRAAEKSNQAVFKVLRWTGGNFQLDFEGKTDKETTQLNTQGLLMEGLRLLDESAREGGAEAEPGPPPTPASTPSMPPSSAGRGRREEEEDVLLDG